MKGFSEVLNGNWFSASVRAVFMLAFSSSLKPFILLYCAVIFIDIISMV